MSSDELVLEIQKIYAVLKALEAVKEVETVTEVAKSLVAVLSG
jgi:hypothetical protein